MKTICLIICHILSYLVLVAQTGNITNIEVSQRTDGSGLVDVFFDLSGGAVAYSIILEASLDGGSTYVPLSGSHLTGDKEQVAPGDRNHLIWNAQESFPNTFSPTSMLKIIATPGQTGTTGQPCPGMPVFTDPRDGKSYPTVQIGNQCWMAENLAWLPSVVGPGTGSQTTPYHYVYGYNGTSVSAAKATSNYQTYGVLYNWPAALQACPTGWHLPTDAEWKTLEMHLGMSQAQADATGLRGTNEGGKLKESGTSHWISPNTGATNESGFSALPGGYRDFDGTFYRAGGYGLWWSATEDSSSNAWRRRLRYSYSSVSRGSNDKATGFSVRCLRDN